jgi:hypothetical protein
MSKTKLKIRFFTIADFQEEEKWLRSQHQKGWKFVKMILPCFYFFEQCEPEDIIYRLDFKNVEEAGDYKQMYSDFGWEYVGKYAGWWHYFRKASSQADTETEGEIYSDNESKIDMIYHIVRNRMFPLFIVFLCCVIPQSIRSWGEHNGWLIFWLVMLAIYTYILLYCGVKLFRMRRNYTDRK